MGFADAVTTRLFLNRRKSDIEFKMQAIMQRKLAILDECNRISEVLAANIFQNDAYSGHNDAIATPAPLPGLTPVSPIATLPDSEDVPTGYYETQLATLQGVEKELDTRQKKLETELEAVKAEEESMKKIATDHAKKDFKIGS